MSDTISWRQLWEETAAQHGRVHARWLCEEASGAFDEEFDEILDTGVTERSIAHLDSMLARLATGEPLQYVLGHWSFRHLDLLVDRRVLIPRPETELVAEVAISLARELPRPVRAADLGTGSGAIGLSLLHEMPPGTVEVWLTDVSLDALDVARANAAGLGVKGAGARFAHGSWFEAVPDHLHESLALVVSNPPYVAHGDPAVDASVHEWEPAGALYSGDDGLDAVREVASGAARWLQPGGWLVLEIGTGQGQAVQRILETAGFTEVHIRADLAGHDRIAVARRPGSA
ncbi:MAG: peptide chain release factor N(5)-glutamine methyltransferase [Actinobacteria bacterium]|nr:peptide chain release factor N(5)-glutamine methyltransferase [Actinomycetota bacterium]